MEKPDRLEVRRAARLLLGEDRVGAPLAALDAARLKALYRRRALETHPDRFAHLPAAEQAALADRFRGVAEAYAVLTAALAAREPPPAPVKSMVPFGRWLHRRGLISQAQLVAALEWQRAHRPSLGEIARRWGWLSGGDVTRVLSTAGATERFGEKAVRLNLLTPVGLGALLRHQQAGETRLGRYFVERRILTALDVEREAHAHERRAA